MIGSILVHLALAGTVFSGVLYFYHIRSRDGRTLEWARYSYQFAVIAVMSFSALLLYYILTHQFQYTYVWSYSSRDLPTPLLVSTFYAGQEGSFTLWTLYTALLGVFLMAYTQRRGYDAEVMSVWNLVLGVLLILLVVKNPFTMIWDSFPNDLIQSGAVPAGMKNWAWVDQEKGLWSQIPLDGRGLNPLLQNYWMVIHPQILFIGFTSMAVPYAFAMAGLMRREYQTWVRVAKPWTVFGGAVLGTGIILGGYWAYETLGWGGYWGWDPVENSSLIPWLVTIASIHTIMAQLRSGTFMRTNFILSILCFVMVLYSTFLTRSGVLGDTSVHSFVDPGMWAYWILLGTMVLFTGLGAFMLARRWKEMPRVPVEHSIYSREFALFIGAFAILFAAFFITIGTSSPIITEIMKGKKAAIDTAFYVKTTLPIGIIVALLMGIGQLLWWRTSNARSFFRSLLYPTISTVLFTGVLIVLGMRDLPVILFTFSSAFALFVNILVGYQIFKGNPRYAGGAIAHVGMAILFLGFVASARYDDKQTVSLEVGKPVEIIQGYRLTYTGNHQIDAERYGFHVSVQRGQEQFEMTPVMRFSSFTNSMLRHPDVLNMYTKDFYISPLSVEQPSEAGAGNVTLLKNEPREIGGASVTFVDFNFSDADMGNMMGGGEFTIGVLLDVSREGKTERIELLMKNQGGQVVFEPKKSTLSPAEFTIVRIQPNNENKDQSRVEISVKDPSGAGTGKGETLIVEASIKPYINLVWMGTVTLLIGFIVTIVRRVAEANNGDQNTDAV